MNEFVKLMPKMLMGSELDEQLRILPEYDESIRESSVTERLIALQDIYRIFVPNQMSREIYSKLYLALLRSLQKKESILAVTQFRENAKIVRKLSYGSIIGGSDSFSVIGASGIGKSSAVSRAINILTETPLLNACNTKLIPCLFVQTPADSSIRGLLLEILRKADELLQTKYHANAIKSHSTVDMLIGSVSQVALNHIGLLAVDEIQNVMNSKKGKIIIGTLTQLINNSGVSICMVGTPECLTFFEQAMMLARRTLGLQYSQMEFDEEFCDFCRTILNFCYVQNVPEVNEEMLMWLYQHSSGNLSIVVGLIHDAQEIAVLEGYEKLDIASLNLAFKKRMSLLHGFISLKPVNYPKVGRKNEKLPMEIAEVSSEDGEREWGEEGSLEMVMANRKTIGMDIQYELRERGISVIEVKIK